MVEKEKKNKTSAASLRSRDFFSKYPASRHSPAKNNKLQSALLMFEITIHEKFIGITAKKTIRVILEARSISSTFLSAPHRNRAEKR